MNGVVCALSQDSRAGKFRRMSEWGGSQTQGSGVASYIPICFMHALTEIEPMSYFK